jgi:alpha-amylase
VENLPDIKTEDSNDVELPPQLVEKWKAEGRYDEEMKELDAFFKRTGHPRAPRFYIMKWLTDYITDYGIDGYRVDTVKHTEEYVWQEFRVQCDYYFDKWKQDNPEKVLDDSGFYLVGEVYNYDISAGRAFDFGDKKVDYFDKAFDALINFELKRNAAEQDYEAMFSRYSTILNEDKGIGVLNYFTSHDDGGPFDKDRTKPFESATKLLLSPGASQVYYGDESARSLIIEGTNGDATLRSFMNWDDIKNNEETKNILEHWQKLGKFRINHPSVGAGVHKMLSKSPYVFSRSFQEGNYNDEVVIGLDLAEDEKEISVGEVFSNGTKLKDAYSGVKVKVSDGKVTINTPYNIVLLEKI